MKPTLPAICLFLLLFVGCAKEIPKLLFQSNVVGDGGLLARDLYRSPWLPPGSDEDLIRVVVIPPTSEVRFKALHRMRIRAWAESSSWEVASPDGVRWTVRSAGTSRPAVTTHVASVAERLLSRGVPRPVDDLERWQARGFPSARWVGPPAMDTGTLPATLERWLLALAAPGSKEAAARLCAAARERSRASCRVIPRIELPPAARGILSAEGSNFSKEFEGLLELVSPRGPIEVEEFLPEERTGVRTAERFGPRLFVVPFPDATVALLQSTSFRDYLEGVVPSEIFPGADDEALRAQAIVARTYAARYDGLSEAARPYLICASTDCQVYRGVSLKKSPTSRAVRDTADLVLRTADGGLAQTYYHSICGGHTEPNSAVFGTRPQSYLAGSDDTEAGAVRPLITDEAVAAYLDAPATAYCGLASLTKKDRWRWTVDLDASKLDDVARSLGLVPPLTALRVSKRGVSGRVLELLLETPKKRRKVTGELVIRRLLGGLLSSLFLLEPGAEDGRIRSLRIRGAGYGHGVGLCQMGAIGRAERGLDFRAILEAYYPGTSLVPLKEAVVK